MASALTISGIGGPSGPPTTVVNPPTTVEERRIGLSAISPFFPMNAYEVAHQLRLGKSMTTEQWNAKMIGIIAAWGSPSMAKTYIKRYNIGATALPRIQSEYKIQWQSRQRWNQQHSGGFFKDLGNFFNDAFQIGTLGLVDLQKGRVYVPFSGASARAGAKAVARSNASLFYGFQGKSSAPAFKTIQGSVDSPIGRLMGTIAAAISAAATGYGVSSGLSAPSAVTSTSGAGVDVVTTGTPFLVNTPGGAGLTGFVSGVPSSIVSYSAPASFLINTPGGGISSFSTPVVSSNASSIFSSAMAKAGTWFDSTIASIKANPGQSAIAATGTAFTLKRVAESSNPFAALVNTVAGAVGLPPPINPGGGGNPGGNPGGIPIAGYASGNSGGSGGGVSFGSSSSGSGIGSGILWVSLIGLVVLAFLKLRK